MPALFVQDASAITDRLGHLRDAGMEAEFLRENWPHERRQLARFILLVASLQLLFSFVVVTEFGWDWRFFAGLGLRSFAFIAWLFPLWMSRQVQRPHLFDPILYAAGLIQLVTLQLDGAYISIGDLDYTTNILLETIVAVLLFYRTPRYLILLLLGNFLSFLFIYHGIHTPLEYARTAEFCSALSVLGVVTAIYRNAQERKFFLSNRQLQQQEKLKLLADERTRLAQDMHDGLGGQLTAALCSLQNSKLSPQEVEALLVSCIDDLRLVVDATAPMDGDLLSALGNLRYRMESRLRQAGIILFWKLGTLPDQLSLPPDRMLHILRIVQEGLTNVLKHAEANTVVVSLDLLPNGEFCIEISDDGIGADFDQTPGANPGKYGFANMRKRASSLAAQLSFTRNEIRGMSLRLVTPIGEPTTE